MHYLKIVRSPRMKYLLILIIILSYSCARDPRTEKPDPLSDASPVKNGIIAFEPTIRDRREAQAFAVIHWGDVRVTWPENAVIPDNGRPYALTLNLRKDSTSEPLPAYLVNWTIFPHEYPTSAKTLFDNQSESLETKTDEKGNTQATITKEIHGEHRIDRIKLELRKPTGELLAVRIVAVEWTCPPNPQILVIGPTQGMIGEKLVFNICITNHSQFDIEEMVIINNIYAGFEYVSSSREPSQFERQELLWNFGTLPRHTQIDWTVTLKAAATGILRNTVTGYSKDCGPRQGVAYVEIGGKK